MAENESDLCPVGSFAGEPRDLLSPQQAEEVRRQHHLHQFHPQTGKTARLHKHWKNVAVNIFERLLVGYMGYIVCLV